MADENLLPKSGVDTSSFKLAAVSALAPIVFALVLLVIAAFAPYPEVRSELLSLLKYVVTAGLIGGAGIGVQYVRSRGNVSVAKLDAYKTINAPPSGQSVTVEQSTKE